MLADLQQTRPIARWDDDARVIDWPRITFECGRLGGGREGAGRDVVLVRGPEPSLRWPTVASTRRRRRAPARRAPGRDARRHSRRSCRTARPRSSPRRRRSARSRRSSSPLRPDYAGPTGLQTVVLRALGDAGIPRCGPLGAGAAVRRRARRRRPRSARCSPGSSRSYNLELDLRALDERSQAYLRRVEAGLAARPDVKEVVDQIDERQEGAHRRSRRRDRAVPALAARTDEA